MGPRNRNSRISETDSRHPETETGSLEIELRGQRRHDTLEKGLQRLFRSLVPPHKEGPADQWFVARASCLMGKRGPGAAAKIDWGSRRKGPTGLVVHKLRTASAGLVGIFPFGGVVLIQRFASDLPFWGEVRCGQTKCLCSGLAAGAT